MLASIQKIISAEKHPNADRLSIIKLQGWTLVTGEKYQAGDLAIHIQVDSLVPRKDWSSFLFLNDNDEYARVKHAKLRGVVSQGLLVPISIPELAGHELKEGLDVSEILGVKKYEKPIEGNHSFCAGSFPSHIVSKTDEPRLQSYMEMLWQLMGQKVYVTKKFDGSSATILRNADGELEVCSRKQSLKNVEGCKYWIAAKKHDFSFLKNGEAIQGELCGPAVQGNKMGDTELNIRMFNFSRNRKYVDYQELKDICANNSLNMVTEVGIFEVNEDLTLDFLQNLADNTKYDNGSPCEGIVVRPIKETICKHSGERVSFKVISQAFALKHGE